MAYSVGFYLLLLLGLLVVAGVAYYLLRAPKLPPPYPGFPPSQYVDISDFRLHYVEKGKGPPLVLLHGIGANIYCWRFLLDPLSQNFRVIALDLPGFGLSDKRTDLRYGLDQQTDRILEFMEKLNLSAPYLLGCSMGGLLALWLARREPRRFPRVACIAPATDPRLVPFAAQHLGIFHRPLRWAVNRTLVRSILKRVVARHELITDEAVEHYFHPYHHDKDAVNTFLKATETLRDHRIPGELKEVRVPVLVLWGHQEKIIPVHYFSELLKILPFVQSFSHPLGGHHLIEDEPAWVLRHITDFFALS